MTYPKYIDAHAPNTRDLITAYHEAIENSARNSTIGCSREISVAFSISLQFHCITLSLVVSNI